ncbi:MAG: aminotransferase class III-fold pyridoxal phosphate-dependent enzyme, partial [Rhodanobacteraceae bacterium]
RTFGSLAATPNAAYHEGFEPLPLGFRATPFNDVAALDGAIDERVAAFIVEPVQGESGVFPADAAFLAAARRLCDERGALLIFDEIQCGMGRLGPLFAFEHAGVRPDVVTLAKALANGLPIGAMLATERVARGLQPGDHGTTFGGSPVPCAAALAHLRARDELALSQRVPVAGARLRSGLERIAGRYPLQFGSPRGFGLLLGLPVLEPHDAETPVTALRSKGVLVGKAGGNTLLFAPPLFVSDAQIDAALDTLDAVAESAA